MPSRRPGRFVLAALLAGLFGVVSVAHAAAHLGAPAAAPTVAAGESFDGGMGCALCQNAAAIQSSVPHLQVEAVESIAPLPPVSASLPSPDLSGPSSRGPPA